MSRQGHGSTQQRQTNTQQPYNSNGQQNNFRFNQNRSGTFRTPSNQTRQQNFEPMHVDHLQQQITEDVVDEEPNGEVNFHLNQQTTAYRQFN